MRERIEHEGVISRIDKEKAWVVIMQSSACADCHAKTMCRISEQREKIVEIPDIDASFQAGDKVIVVGSASLGLQAVGYAFVIPLILVVVGLIMSFSFFNSESLAAMVAIVILVAYFFILYIFKDRFKKKFVFKMKKNI